MVDSEFISGHLNKPALTSLTPAPVEMWDISDILSSIFPNKSAKEQKPNFAGRPAGQDFSSPVGSGSRNPDRFQLCVVRSLIAVM